MILADATIGMEINHGTYNIGFNNETDETQFDVNSFEELQECWSEFCKENSLNEDSVSYVEEGKEYDPHGNYDDIIVYVPGRNTLVTISEGTGDQLLQEDLNAGYVDYIDYKEYLLDRPFVMKDGFPELPDEFNLREGDGGIVMLKNMLRDDYACLKDCVSKVLDELYCTSLLPYRTYKLLDGVDVLDATTITAIVSLD